MRYRFVAPMLLAYTAACAGGPWSAPETAAGVGDDGAAASIPARAYGEPALEAVRRATERFRDVNVALAEGYRPDPKNMCVTAEMTGRPAADGAMGIHYARPDLQGITNAPAARVTGTGTHTDFLTPTNLLYEPQPDGALELVAVENLVFARAWAEAGNRESPSFHGVPYDLMADDPATDIDEAHGFEPHYDRHVWLYRENPNGIFAPFNPAVTCGKTTRRKAEFEGTELLTPPVERAVEAITAPLTGKRGAHDGDGPGGAGPVDGGVAAAAVHGRAVQDDDDVRRRPSGTYEHRVGPPVDFFSLTLNADRTFTREAFVICDSAPCPPVPQAGRYGFARRGRTRFIDFSRADGQFLDRYAYTLAGDTLTLRRDGGDRTTILVAAREGDPS